MPINHALMITPEMKHAEAIAGVVNSYRTAIQTLIDTKANERQYDSGVTLASYVNSTIEEWAIEAQAFVAWRDAVWIYALAELEKVQKGDRVRPTVAELLAELPGFAI